MATSPPPGEHSSSEDPTAPPDASALGMTPIAEQLEMYARDVQALHSQRQEIAEELRKVERRLAGTLAEQQRTRARLEREHEHVQTLEAERRRAAAVAPVAPARTRRRVNRAAALGFIAGFITALLLFWLVAQSSLFDNSPAVRAPLVVTRVVENAEATPTPLPQVLVAGAAVGALATPDISRLIEAAMAGSAPVVSTVVVPGAAPAGAPQRCATELLVPALAPGVAYVARVNQVREEPVTVLWPVARGRIGMASFGSAGQSARTPAIVPITQMPAALLQLLSPAPELTAPVQPGQIFVLLVNDTAERFDASRAALFFAGDAQCS